MQEENIEATDKEFAQWLFAQPCVFMRGAPSLKDLPLYSLSEVAFVGRSNVGKSSLINALTNRSTLARTSNTPGRTQHLNFFELGGRIILVDMPGYGFAKANKQIVHQWHNLIKEYLMGRPTLKRVYLLIDARHGIKTNDKEMMTLLDKSAVSYQLVITKIDKINSSQILMLEKQIHLACASHPACHPRIVLTSSQKKEGLLDLKVEISFFAAAAQDEV